MKTIDAAKGKWRQILEAFGIERQYLDGRHHACPCTGEGEDRFRFSDQNGSGAFFCSCSKGDRGGMGLLQCKTGRDFASIAKEVDELIGNNASGPVAVRKRTFAESLVAIAKPTERSVYLERRGLEMAPGLRWAQNVTYYSDGEPVGKFAAMLAPITLAGEFQTFHVTYLEKGEKARVPVVRKILPGGWIMGGGVELYPAAEEMGVAEGIETAIAAKMLFDCPTHSAVNAAMLAKWDPPEVAKVVHIFADNDANLAGHAAAWTLAHRLTKYGIAAYVHMPQEVNTDWNDVLLRTRKAA